MKNNKISGKDNIFWEMIKGYLDIVISKITRHVYNACLNKGKIPDPQEDWKAENTKDLLELISTHLSNYVKNIFGLFHAQLVFQIMFFKVKPSIFSMSESSNIKLMN